MKSYYLSTLALTVLLAFSACEKTDVDDEYRIYRCECTVNTDQGSTTYETDLQNLKRHEAEKACRHYGHEVKASVIPMDSVNCEIFLK